MGKGEYLGEFEQIVLLSLAHLRREAVGRRIYHELVDVTGRDVSVAAVYITLARLEKKGYVGSSLGAPDENGGKPRKYYALKQAGARALRESRDQLQRLWRGARFHPELKAK
jgi:DNA-binding PadR family transcriptional regulator